MMRKQEQSSLVNKRETRNEYLERLKKAVSSLPKVFTDMTIDDRAGRCRRLCKVCGGHYEEGGLACVCVCSQVAPVNARDSYAMSMCCAFIGPTRSLVGRTEFRSW